jgi:hypothetical protein
MFCGVLNGCESFVVVVVVIIIIIIIIIIISRFQGPFWSHYNNPEVSVIDLLGLSLPPVDISDKR